MYWWLEWGQTSKPIDTLSARGLSYLGAMQHALSSLDQANERFRTGTSTEAFKLVAVEAFAEMWLASRFAAFREANTTGGELEPMCPFSGSDGRDTRWL